MKNWCILLLFIFTLSFINAYVILPESFTVEINETTTYNITFNNTGVTNLGIMTLTFHIPESFTFIVDSWGTNSHDDQSSFNNGSDFVLWENVSYLINGEESANFWFDVNTSNLGKYNLTLEVLPDGAEDFDYNISIEVIDSTNPTISFKIPTPSDDSIISNNPNIPVNITADDNVAIDTITIELYNGTTLLDSQTNNTSPFFYNFTNLANETYKIIAKVNDTFGNEVSLERTITIGPQPCISDWFCPMWTPNECLINTNQTRTCTDLNDCVTKTDTPDEIRTCIQKSSCTSDWNCTSWNPIICPEDGTQTRTCTDSNNCSNETGKPSESQLCILESVENLGEETDEGIEKSVKKSKGFSIIIGTIIVIIIIVVGLIFYFKKKNSQNLELQNNQVNSQQISQSSSKPL